MIYICAACTGNTWHTSESSCYYVKRKSFFYGVAFSCEDTNCILGGPKTRRCTIVRPGILLLSSGISHASSTSSRPRNINETLDTFSKGQVSCPFPQLSAHYNTHFGSAHFIFVEENEINKVFKLLQTSEHSAYPTKVTQAMVIVFGC